MEKIFCLLLVLILSQISMGKPINSRDERLIAMYHFNENTGTFVKDSTTNGHHGTVIDGAWVTGKYGPGVYFNGSTANIEISTNTDLEPTQFTITSWVKADGVPNNNRYGIFHSGYGGAPADSGYWLCACEGSSDGEFLNKKGLVFGTNVDGTWKVAGNATNIVGNTWYFAAGTYDGVDLKMYVNCILEGTRTVAVEYAPPPTMKGIGCFFATETSLLYWKGIIDEVTLYNKALTLGELKQRYLEKKGKYIN